MTNRYWRSLNKIWKSTQCSRDISVTFLETFLYYTALRIPVLRQQQFRFQWKSHRFWARPVDDRAVAEVLLNQEYAFAVSVVAHASTSPTVIDGGANIGLFSLATLAVRPDAVVHALEPDSHTFHILQRNVRSNSSLQWTIHRLALWRESGPLKFGVTGTSTSSRVYDLNPEGRVETVQAITLEAFVSRYIPDNITLLKLDIEGAEEAVLRQSESILPRVENLVVEIHKDVVSESLIMSLLHTYFPYIHSLSRHDSAKPLILASRIHSDLAQLMHSLA